MGRRASSSINTTAIVGVAAVLAVLVAAGALFLLKDKGGSSFTGTPFPVDDAYSGANSLRDNEYTLEGTVTQRHPRDSGLGLEIQVESGGEEKPVFISVPNDVATINIERNTKYAFKVRVGKGGIPVATNVKRL